MMVMPNIIWIGTYLQRAGFMFFRNFVHIYLPLGLSLPDGSTILNGGQDRRHKQSTGIVDDE